MSQSVRLCQALCLALSMHFTDDETKAWRSQGSYLNTETTQPLSGGARMQPKFALLLGHTSMSLGQLEMAAY